MSFCNGNGAFEDLGYAKPDFDRARRQGVGEVIYGEGKTAPQIAGIVRSLVGGGQERVLITRLDVEKSIEVARLLYGFTAEASVPAHIAAADEPIPVVPDEDVTVLPLGFEYYEEARLAIVGGMPPVDGMGLVVIAAAGTSDLAVAEEAALTAEFLGNEVRRLYDVGVAGVHRLLAHEDLLRRANVVVAVAGMEGALPSVVGGLVSCPVIAVPTSIGYGASFGGVAALLAMLNSCASGVSVVNIDNGFGGGYQASLINHPTCFVS